MHGYRTTTSVAAAVVIAASASAPVVLPELALMTVPAEDTYFMTGREFGAFIVGLAVPLLVGCVVAVTSPVLPVSTILAGLFVSVAWLPLLAPVASHLTANFLGGNEVTETLLICLISLLFTLPSIVLPATIGRRIT